MGVEIFEDSRVEYLFQAASDIMEFDIRQLMLEGPEEKLNATEYAQPAIFTDSLARFELLVDEGYRPDCLLGHSLGEFSALVAAGCITFEQGIRVVKKRGVLTGNVDVDGSMVAVLGVEYPKVEEIIGGMDEAVTVANYNSPKQIVISGREDHLTKSCKKLRSESAKCIKLDVTGPFHSEFMKKPERELGKYINEYDFKDPEVPVLSGVSGEFERSGSKLQELLTRQMTHPVNWVEYVNKLVEYGIDTTVEVGPAATLTKLNERIDSELEGKRFDEVI